MSAFRYMLAPGYAGFAHVASGLPYPTAGTDRPVGDGAPRFASQIEAAVALRDRLNRDRVPHAPYHRKPWAAWEVVYDDTGSRRGYRWSLDDGQAA